MKIEIGKTTYSEAFEKIPAVGFMVERMYFDKNRNWMDVIDEEDFNYLVKMHCIKANGETY